MKIRSLISNLFIAFFAQGISFLASAIMSLLLPKVLDVEQFGYWQLFLFYANYVGFAHLGINDGIYLLNGGIRRNDIDKRNINSQFTFSVLYQTAIAILVILFVCGIDIDNNRRNVIICTAVFMVIQNAASFLGYLFQAMDETKKYSYSVIINKIAFIASLFCLFIFHNKQYYYVIAIYMIATTISLLYCLYNAKKFIVSGIITFRYTVKECIQSINVGYKLMFANVSDMCILGIAQYLIDNRWGISVFARLSLAISLVNFFITFMTQTSMVLFPALRQEDLNNRLKFYTQSRDALSLITPIVYVFYAPIVYILSFWLPNYRESFLFFAYLLPICVFNIKMDICCTTYFKVFRYEKQLLIINVIAVTLCAVFSLIPAFLLHSLIGVVAAPVIVILLRSLCAELYLNRMFHVNTSFLSIYNVIISILFIFVYNSCGLMLSFIVMCVAYLIFLAVNYKTVIRLYHSFMHAVE
jgi:O-antigen/teichoic acid export membrane protein